MPTKRTSKTTSFADLVEKAYLEMRRLYDDYITKHSDRNEDSRRAGAKRTAQELLEGKHRLAQSRKGGINPVLSGMKRRYDKFVAMHYSLGEYRIAEWFDSDWEIYLRDEHHVGDPDWNQRDINKDVLRASELKLKDVERILSYDFAYRKIYTEHIASLNQSEPEIEENEPNHYVTENVRVRRKDAFDRWQCTAFILTLIDALTNHTLAHDFTPSDFSSTANIHNLNVMKFATSISLVTGLNADNIKKDIYKLRNGSAMDSDGRLLIVRESLRSFGVNIDTSLLDEAINRSEI
jgi:hypothetical protein